MSLTTSLCVPSRVRGTLAVAVTVAITTAAPVFSQCPPTWITGGGPNGQGIGTFGISGVGAQVNALATTLYDSSGLNIIAGGAFTGAGTTNTTNLASYNLTSGTWTSMSLAGAGQPNGAINALLSGPLFSNDRYIVVAGDFTLRGTTSMPHIAVVDVQTKAWFPLGTSGINGPVYALAKLSDGSIIAGGAFTNQGGIAAADNIVRYDLNTQQWGAIGGGLPGTVRAIVVLPGDEIVAGGLFSSGTIGQGISRFRPSTGAWTPIGPLGPLGTGVNGQVYSLSLLSDGEVLVGGQFTSITAGQPNIADIARVNVTTGVWSACASGVTGTEATGVFSLLSLPPAAATADRFGASAGGEALVGGLFSVNGSSGLARYSMFNNTIIYPPFPPAAGAGTSGKVSAMLLLPDGSVVVGGRFSSAGPGNASNIARLTPGSAPPTLLGQPLSVNTYRTGTAMLAVTVIPAPGTGTPFYRWSHDGVPLDTVANPSAATATLTLTNVQEPDLGSYACTITNSCGGDGPTSNAALVSFVPDQPPLCPADVGVQGGGFGHDGVLDNNDFISFINEFFNGC